MNSREKEILEKTGKFVEVVNIKYEYDENGRVIHQLSKNRYERQITRYPDGKVHTLTSLNLKNNKITRKIYDYNVDGNLMRTVTFLNFTTEKEKKTIYEYEYDYNGTVVCKYLLEDDGSRVLDSMTKKVFNDKGVIIHSNRIVGQKFSETYYYDNKDRLVRTVGKGYSERNYYDDKDNIIKKIIDRDETIKTIYFKNDDYGNPINIKTITNLRKVNF